MRKLIFCLILIFFVTGCSDEESTEISSFTELNSVENITLTIIEINIEEKQVDILLSNETSKDCFFDSTFIVEEKRENDWYRINIDQYFNALGYILDDQSAQEITLKLENELQPGEYRIIKSISVDGETDYLSANFTVNE